MLIFPEVYKMEFKVSNTYHNKQNVPINTDFVVKINLDVENIGNLGDVKSIYTISFKMVVPGYKPDYVNWYFHDADVRDRAYIRLARELNDANGFSGRGVKVKQ